MGKTVRELLEGQETSASRKKRLGKQAVSRFEEQRIVDNLVKKARARGEKLTQGEALRRFRTSQETTIGKRKVKTKGGGKGRPIVSRKTGKRVKGGILKKTAKTRRTTTPRQAILKTRPRTKLA